MPYEFLAKNGLISQGNITATGSLAVTQNISASATGSFGIVGIGTNSPLAALDVRSQAMIGDASIGGVAYQTLSVGGHTRIHGTYRLQFGSANGGYASIGITGTTTGTLTFNTWDATTDRERLRIVNTNGYIGVGTTNPSTLLQLNGDAASHQIFSINRSGSATPAVYIGNDSNSNALIASNNTVLRFGKDFTGTFNEYVRIDTNGNVGIGTTTVSRKLHTYIDTGPVMRLQSSGSNASIEFIPSSGHNKYNWLIGAQQNISDAFEITPSTATNGTTFSTPSILVKSDGNVGIGMTSPTTRLHVSGSHVSGNGISRFEGTDFSIISLKAPGTGDGTNGYWGFRAQDTSNNDLMFYGYRYTSTFSGFWVDPSFSQNITKGFFVRNSDGSVGIGTNSPSAKLHVNSSGSLAAGSVVFRVEGTSGSLFSVDDTLSGSLMSVNDITGLPILEVFSDDRVVMGTFNANTLVVTGSRVGIGTSSPAFLLDVNGSSRHGSSASDVHQFTGSINLNGSLSTNANITASNISASRTGSFGAVGIGTSNVDAKLTILGTSTQGTAYNAINLNNSDRGGASIGFKNFTDASVITLASVNVISEDVGSGNYNDGVFTINTAADTVNSERFRITSRGQVGIGTTNPDMFARSYGKILGISGSSAAIELNSVNGTYLDLGVNGTIIGNLFASSIAYEVGTPGNFPMHFYTSGSYKMSVLVNGNVGIGTTSPSDLLNLYGANKNIRITNTTAYNGAGTSYLGFTGYYTSSNDISWFSRLVSGKENITDGDLRGYFAIQTNNPSSGIAERVRVDSNGYVGIGTTTPNSKLEVAGNASSPPIISVYHTTQGRSGSLGIDTSGVYIQNSNNGDYFDLKNASGTSKFRVIYDNNTFLNTTYTSVGSLTSSGSKLSVFGNLSVGSTYGSTAAPSNGAIFQGGVGIGTTNPYYAFDVYTNSTAGALMSLRTSGSANARIYFDAANGDLSGGDYCYIGQESGSLNFVINTDVNSGNIHIQPRFGSATDGRLIVSGSSQFGRSLSSTHQFTGSVIVSGSHTLTGNQNIFGYLYMNNNNIEGINALVINDPGPGEGLVWNGGRGWAIYESPNDLSTNSGGNLQFVSGSGGANVRRLTLSENGTSTFPTGSVGIGTDSPISLLNVYGSGSNLSLLKVDGANGTLFEITDNLSGSLFNVNTISGLPVLEVFSDNTVIAGKYGSNDFVITGNKVGIGTSVPTQKLEVQGNVQIGNDSVTNVGLKITRLNGGMRTSEHTYHSSQNSPWYTFGQNLTWTGELAGTVESTQAYRPYFEGFAPAAGYKVFGYMDVTAGAFTSANVVNALVIKNDGNVGIGTTNPDLKLSVVSGSMRVASGASAGTIYFGKLSDGLYLQRDNNYDFSLVQNEASGNGLYLAGAGNVYVSIDANDNETDRAFIVQNNAIKTGSELFRVNESGRVGVGTSLPSASLHVVGDAILNGFKTIQLDRTVAAALNSYTDIGNFVRNHGAHSMIVSVNANINSYSVSKTYIISNAYNTTAGSWKVALPITDSGPFNDDFQLLVNFDLATCYLRLRKSFGSSFTGTYNVTILYTGYTDAVFTPSVSTGTDASTLGLLDSTVLTQIDNNVGIGTASPSGKLEIRTDTGSNYVFSGSSSSGYTSTFLMNDTALYVGHNSAVRSLTLKTNSTDRVTVTGGGNVGIGTTGPACPLDVVGNTATTILRTTAGVSSSYAGLRVYNDQNSAFRALEIDYAGSAYTGPLVTGGPTGEAASIGTTGAFPMTFATNNTARMTVVGGGNVGIGTISPTSLLELSSSTATNPLNVKGVGSWGTSILVISSSGKIGFGTNSPSYAVHVQNYSTAQSGMMYINAALNSSGKGLVIDTSTRTVSENSVLALEVINTSGTNTLAATVGGNVGIGITNPAAKLAVTGSGTGQMLVGDAGFGVSGNYTGLSVNGTLSTTSYNLLSSPTDTNLYINRPSGNDIRFRENNQDQMVLLTGGNLGIGTSSPSAKVQISGSANSVLLNVKSPISGNIVYVTGSGAVGINTATPAYTLQVNGSFAATTKSFVIDHPTKPDKKLVYGSLESPYHGIRLTGRDTLIDGKCVVELPDYISKLVLPETVNIQLTGIKCNKVLYVDEINIKENKFTVAYDKGVFESYKDYDFFWDFTAIRADVPQLKTEI